MAALVVPSVSYPLFIAGCLLGSRTRRHPRGRRFETDPPAGFETRILPILQAKCLACHGPQNQEKELDLGSRQSLLKGRSLGAFRRSGVG